MPRVTFAEAMAAAIREVMAADDRVLIFSPYFGALTSAQRHFATLAAEFGDRVADLPISELGAAGMATGAALMGMRPIINLGTASFVFQGFAQVVNEAANVHYASGGQSRAPVVFHLLAGIRGAGAAQHSHTPQAMFWNTPGLEIMVPSTPADVYGLLKTAVLGSDNPTVFINHCLLLDQEGEVEWGAPPIPFGQGRIARAGADVTIVASSVLVPAAMAAAAQLAAQHGVDAEVIDLRTLVPLDEELMLRSVTKTGRVVVADECHRSCGVGAELVARIAESAFPALKAAPQRVVTPDVPIPFSPVLEETIRPAAAGIVAAALRCVSAR